MVGADGRQEIRVALGCWGMDWTVLSVEWRVEGKRK